MNSKEVAYFESLLQHCTSIDLRLSKYLFLIAKKSLTVLTEINIQIQQIDYKKGKMIYKIRRNEKSSQPTWAKISRMCSSYLKFIVSIFFHLYKNPNKAFKERRCRKIKRKIQEKEMKIKIGRLKALHSVPPCAPYGWGPYCGDLSHSSDGTHGKYVAKRKKNNRFVKSVSNK